MNKEIPVIDLFAGPGGLGEGFSSFEVKGRNPFNISLSIEKDYSAYRTLRLRSFFRKIPFEELRQAYIQFAKSERSEKDEHILYSQFPWADYEVKNEVFCKELGGANFHQSNLDKIISDKVSDSKMWVLIGGPPCQAYSLAGRSRLSNLRKNNPEQYENDERHYLYRHYLKILANHKPPVFVMENVKGLLSSKVNGCRIIDKILQDLSQPKPDGSLKYNLYSFVKNRQQKSLFHTELKKVSDYIIEAERYGIPQTRHRVIIFGVRNDINIKPATLKEADRVCLRDILSDLPRIRSEVSIRGDSNLSWSQTIKTITEKLGRHEKDHWLVPILFMNLNDLDDTLPTGGNFLNYSKGRPHKIVKKWYRKENLPGVCNHEAKSHMPSDLHRYFYSASFISMHKSVADKKSPNLSDFPKTLLPKHKNIDKERVEKTIFIDRFRVQPWDDPATTITSHISKDGHYYIHPDYRQCRSLTVREAARIQTFPDSYIFLGSRTSQYSQVGNAVPPILAEKLACVVADLLERWCG